MGGAIGYGTQICNYGPIASKLAVSVPELDRYVLLATIGSESNGIATTTP